MNKETYCVGYSFVKPQELKEVFCPEDALLRATLFPELLMPYGVYGKCPCREWKGACER